MEKCEPLVYIVQIGEDGPVKIGRSSTVALQKRVDALQSASFGQLHVRAVLSGGPELERELHDQFAEYRMRGEWFHPAGELFNKLESHPRLRKATVVLRKPNAVRRMPSAEARKIWLDRSIPYRVAIKLIEGWSWKAAVAAFGPRTGNPNPRFRIGHSPEVAKRFGSMGGKANAWRLKRELQRMPKRQAEVIWLDPLNRHLSNEQVIERMDGWTIRAAYRHLRPRGLAKGRPRSKQT